MTFASSHALDLLKWQFESGVMDVLEHEPCDWRKMDAAPVRLAPAPVPAAPIQTNSAPLPVATPRAAVAPVAAIAQARALADAANTLAELRQAVEQFDGCALKRTAKNTVFCDGNPQGRLMLIGEAPGANEDIQGIPFCGVSGILLDKMLASIGRDRTNAYISNTVFWRPPGNRQPNSEELAICRPFVEKHIALAKPALLVLVGGIATQAMMDSTTSLSRLRGKTYPYQNGYLSQPIPTCVLYHPSYLLRSPAQKRLAWADLLFLKDQFQIVF